MAPKITIAIDGHSSTGKSTLARQLAAKLGYIYVDSGAMYRCVTLFAMQNGFFMVDDELDVNALIGVLPNVKVGFFYDKNSGLNRATLNGNDVEDQIRSMDVSTRVSTVAAISEVRTFLVAQQQEMGAQKGVVMDGRDIGTVVFPNAELKIFMTASAEIRAQRRFLELKEKGEQADFVAVLENVKHRDHIDSTRQDSPLLQAPDAKLLDNSDLSKEAQFNKVLNWAENAILKSEKG